MLSAPSRNWIGFILLLALVCKAHAQPTSGGSGAGSLTRRSAPTEINPPPLPDPQSVVAIIGARLVDGRGGPPILDSAIVIQREKILSVGTKASVTIPADAQIVEATGLTLLPGLIDAHFHLDRVAERPGWFFRHGVTSMRDPGVPFEDYDVPRRSTLPMPRLFVAGPHLDCPPPAYPHDAFLVTNATDVTQAINSFVDKGASVIKVYFRLPLELISAATQAAHQRGVPVTAHLELVRADDAILAGVDGIEHVTSFGTVLADPKDADDFRAAVRRDNNARRKGRYDLWSKIDLDQCPRLAPLLDLIVSRKVFISPTLAVFEVRAGDKNARPSDVQAYETMLRFVGRCHRAGATIVVGSHSEVPKAERGWAYHREMELLVECGLTPLEVITAATSNNARFFRIHERLGTIEPGKLADLLLVQGNPTEDIRAMRSVQRVMRNGQWITPTD